MTLPRSEHHTMFTQLYWFHVRVDRDMPHRQQTHCILRSDLARRHGNTDAATFKMALSILLANAA
jgi:hypothetical protein